MMKRKLSEMHGKEVAFYVGKLAKSGEGIIYYKVKDVDPAADRNIQLSYIIYFPLAQQNHRKLNDPSDARIDRGYFTLIYQ